MREEYKNNFSFKCESIGIYNLYIDGEIVPTSYKGFENLFGENSLVSFKTVRDAISSAKPTTLNVYINSPGGSITEAFAIYDYFQILISKGVEVNSYGIGMVASAATIILSGCKNTFLTSNATYMIHNIGGGVMGNIKDVESYYNSMLSLNNSAKDIYSKITGKTHQEISALMDAETYFTAQEALSNNFVQNIVDDKQCISMTMKIKNFKTEDMTENKEVTTVPINEEKVAESIFTKLKMLFTPKAEVKKVETDTEKEDGERYSIENKNVQSFSLSVETEAKLMTMIDKSFEKYANKSQLEDVSKSLTLLGEEVKKIKEDFINNASGVTLNESKDDKKYEGVSFE